MNFDEPVGSVDDMGYKAGEMVCIHRARQPKVQDIANRFAKYYRNQQTEVRFVHLYQTGT